MMQHNSLLVVWQSSKSRSYYHVGTLSHYNGYYEYVYTSKDNDKALGGALKDGYMIHPAFPDVTKTYVAKNLFLAFDRRIPSSDREDFTSILKDLGLAHNASKMDILRATRGRLASDGYSFEQPLRMDENYKLSSTFFINGMRHQSLPKNWPSWIQKGSRLLLKHHPRNEYDSNAVAVYTEEGEMLGYVPSYYSNAICALLNHGIVTEMNVLKVQKDTHAHWWLQVEFTCQVPSEKAFEVNEILAVA